VVSVHCNDLSVRAPIVRLLSRVGPHSPRPGPHPPYRRIWRHPWRDAPLDRFEKTHTRVGKVPRGTPKVPGSNCSQTGPEVGPSPGGGRRRSGGPTYVEPGRRCLYSAAPWRSLFTAVRRAESRVVVGQGHRRSFHPPEGGFRGRVSSLSPRSEGLTFVAIQIPGPKSVECRYVDESTQDHSRLNFLSKLSNLRDGSAFEAVARTPCPPDEPMVASTTRGCDGTTSRHRSAVAVRKHGREPRGLRPRRWGPHGGLTP
jgi:hypothetical protein